jgi:hypothetical protein
MNNDNIPFADKVQLPTIRDQFAMSALASLDTNLTGKRIFFNVSTPYLAVARQAYAIADAMLKARAE